MPQISTRFIFEITLTPVAGELFQPTGFPDIGPAIFEQPGVSGKQNILVESAQSMANRLEAVGWNDNENKPVEVLSSLPWVEVRHVDGDAQLTSSRTEAHRLSSAFIRSSAHPEDETKDMVTFFKDSFQLENDKPISNRDIAQEIFKLDPLCLLHGVFFADPKLPHQPKITRAISACIEAEDIIAVHSGGVKRDHVRHSTAGSEGGSGEGYGSIPFHRTEYIAEKITARFVIDRIQLRSYALSNEATELLETLALWEVRKLLSEPMRLRTACDLEATEELVDQEGQHPPSLDELESKIIALCKKIPELSGVKTPLVVKWSGKKS